jgi:RecA-family ATPase
VSTGLVLPQPEKGNHLVAGLPRSFADQPRLGDRLKVPAAKTDAPRPAKAAAPAAPTTSLNAFRGFQAKGYTRLVSITPPGCAVSERSTLFKRQKDLGKAPGVPYSDGTWRGYDWLKFEPTPEHYDAWAAAGAGVGIRTGDGLFAVDIDTMDEELGDICGRAANEILGASPNRVGRSPKRIKLYRVTGPVPYQRVKFDGGHVEVLSDGKQFVAHGIHPVTGQPYQWPSGVPRYDDLPFVTPAQLAEFMAALAARLPAAKHEAGSTPPAQVTDPAQLAGDVKMVRKAVQALPNTSTLFPSYQSYIEVAQAIKGALPDDDDTGLELFQEWASRWDGGDNDPDRVAADWSRCQPSRNIGAQYLYALADRHSGGAFAAAEVWFTGAPAVDAPPTAVAGRLWTDDQITPSPISADEWRSARPTRPCIVENWFHQDVGHLAAPGGVGKTTLMLFQAIHIVLGRDLFGYPVKRCGPVAFMTAEDDRGTMIARVRNMCAALALSSEQIDAVRSGLFVIDVSGRGFKLTRVDGDVVVPGNGATVLAEKLKSIGPAMLFVDPAVSFGVGESRVNDAEQGLIDAARLIRNEVGCGVMFAHHTSKQNAREKALDQYAGRNGSALADGSRMVHVMQSLTAEEWAAATGDALREGESGVVYARPKMTWSPPNQPPLYLKRRGYTYEAFTPISSAEGAVAQLERNTADVLDYLKAQMLLGVRYSHTTIQDADVAKTRQARRAAVRHLIANGKLVEEEVTNTGGRPRKLLRPV